MSINQITPRTDTVVIFQGDDVTRLAALEEKVARLAPRKPLEGEGSSETGADAGEYASAREEHAALLAEAEGRAVTVVLRAIGRKTWRGLVLKHPPRDGVKEDENMGINTVTFGDDLVPACLASPVFESDALRDVFLDSLSSVQFGELEARAWALNQIGVGAPKALDGP